MGFKLNPLYGTLDIAGSAGAGTGDVVGPASATDNAIARFDGTTGKLIQNSAVTIADTSGNMAGVGTINTLVLPSSDFVGRTDTQTLTNKTLTSPVIAQISNTGTLTLPTSTDTLVGRATTDTFTNKTITATSNTLGGVTMTLGSDATGDIYYRNSSGYLTRLGIGSTDNVLKVSGGLPSWGAAPSTAPTPRYRFTYTAESNSITTSSEGRLDIATNGAGASVTYATSSGVNLVGSTASGTTGYATAYPSRQRTGLYIESKLLDKNPTVYGRIAVFSNTGHKIEFGIAGGAAGSNTTFDGTVNKVLCFRLTRTTAGGLVIYAVSGTGSAETATDITTAATATTGWNTSGTNYDQLYVIDYTSGTSAKFYINGTLMATLTTNLPTGTLTSANNVLQAKVNSNADTSASSQCNIYSFYADMDAI